MSTQWCVFALVAVLAVLRDVAASAGWPLLVLFSATGDALLFKVLIGTAGADVVLAGLRKGVMA